MKRVAAIAGLLLGLMAGQTAANPLPLEGRDINGNPVGATDASAVFEYDPNLNMTWLRDWNYAATTHDVNALPSGAMTWDAAKTWASNLTVGGFSGWSLPAITDTGAPRCDGIAYVGTDCGFNVYGYGTNSPGPASLSPMAYLWYVELGNKAYYDTSGNGPQSGWGLTNTGPFINMQSGFYWSGTESSQDYAWIFLTFSGGQREDNYAGTAKSVVAVRPGDVAASVPEPGTMALLSVSLGALGLVARRKRS
jgi:hypothetical protein